MKRKFLLALVIPLLGCMCAAPAARADMLFPDALIVAFGEMTPPTSNSETKTPAGDSSASGQSGEDKPANNTDNGTAGNSSATGTPSAGQEQNSGAQAGGSIINQYNPNAYAGEKTVEQQVIEDAIQQYGGPRLSSLSVNGVALIPSFSAETFSYAAYLPEGQTGVSITASAASGSVYIDGVAGNTRQITVSGEERTVRVIVAEQNNSTTYTVLLLRALVPIVPVEEITGIPYITKIQIANDDVFFERQISAADGNDITLTLPQASGKKFYVSVTVNRETLVYYNNIRVYNGYYHQDSGAWTWTRQGVQIAPGDTLVGVHLVDLKTKADINYYSFRIVQPAGLQIQLQVGNTEALVGGELYTLDAPPLIMEGHTMVPLRFIAEALGATVSWHQEEQRVDMALAGKTISLFIGKLTDGMPQAPFIENGRTMVPLRYVSERLDCQVEWLAATREIIIMR